MASGIAPGVAFSQPWFVSLRCLIVDDSEEFLASAARLLTSQGLDVVAVATNGDQAVEQASLHGPDVALVDLELGEEDGIALTRVLESRAPSIHIVLISSYQRDDIRDLVVGAPVVGFLPKSHLGADAIRDLLDSVPR